MLLDSSPKGAGQDDSGLFVLLATLAVLAYVFVVPWYRNRYVRHPDTVQTSVLLAHYTQGMSLFLMGEGKKGGMYYSAFTTLKSEFIPQQNQAVASSGAVIYRIELPFHTEAHILGISNNFRHARGHLVRYAHSQAMEEVKLEGEFADVFTLYAASGQQMQVRYVFDPLAMEHVLDYCQTHLWEIVGDELYFVVDNQGGKSGQGNILSSTEEFVRQIRPALVSRLPGHNLPHNTPYGKYRGQPMKCPLCEEPLIEHAHWYECPKHHGRLVNGRHLLAVRHGDVKVKPMEKEVPLEHEEVICPHCSNKMAALDYQHTGIIIDSCPKCSYRWLDAGELKRIAL